jgi:hypothetical protein
LFRLFDDSTGGNIGKRFTSQEPLVSVPFFLTVIYDGSGTSSGITMLRNGILPSQTSNDSGSYTAMENLGNPLIIGDSSTSVVGNIDQPTFWNKALSVAESREAIQLRDYTQHSAYANIISEWGFEDAEISGVTVSDKVGSNDGTLVNGATNSSCIPYPRAYQLKTNNVTPYSLYNSGWSMEYDGINDYTGMGNVLSITTGDFSMGIWVKFKVDQPNSSGGNTIGALIGKGYLGGSTRGYGLMIRNNTAALQIRYGSTITEPGTTNLKDNSWHLAIMSVERGSATGLKLIVNGVAEYTGSSTAFDGIDLSSADNFRLGATSSGTFNYRGLTGDSFMRNSLTTEAEALQMYNNHEARDETETSIDSSLLGYWRPTNSQTGSNNVVDLSGNGNHGTMTNMTDDDVVLSSPRPTFDSANAGSTEFNGTNRYIEVPDASNLSFGNGTTDSPFSIITWVYLTSTSPGDALIGKQDEWELRFRFDARPMLRLVDIGANNVYKLLTNNIATNRWVQIISTYSGVGGGSAHNGMNIYIDSVLDTAFSTSSVGTYVAMDNTANPVRIGRRDTAYLQGNVCYTEVVAKEMSACEVIESFNDGSPADPTETTFTDDAVSHWRLDATDDLTTTGGVTDVIGSNDGTATNMVSGNLSTTNYPLN